MHSKIAVTSTMPSHNKNSPFICIKYDREFFNKIKDKELTV